VTTPADHDGATRRELLKATASGAALIGIPGLLAACGSSSSGATAQSKATSSGKPVRGGTLRVATLGGSESLDPFTANTESDLCRAAAVYERLIGFDSAGKLVNQLATEFDPAPDGRAWTVRLKKGVTWHDGKPLTADDLIYTIRYSLKAQNYAAGAFASIDTSGLKKIDPLTAHIPLHQRNFLFPATLAIPYGHVMQDGTTSFKHPIGTGPFMFESWVPDQNATYVRNPNYHISGQPYLDGLHSVTINDPNARLNALTSNLADISDGLDFTSAATVKGNASLRLVNRPGGTCNAFFMCTNIPPYTDLRVRQALRLLANRDQEIANTMGGYADVGNDIQDKPAYDYDRALTQRTFDPEQAKSLLKQAGQSGLAITLTTCEMNPGLNATAVLFAQQAAQGGVKINLRQVTTDTYFAQYYLKPKANPFGVSYWIFRTIAGTISTAYLPNSPINETMWNNTAFNSAYAAAQAAKDQETQLQHLHDAQKILWDEGGSIIPYFPRYIGATSSRVNGLSSTPMQPFGFYDWRTTFLA
jgi:peptide/nickel transport system substrate-binding protein